MTGRQGQLYILHRDDATDTLRVALVNAQTGLCNVLRTKGDSPPGVDSAASVLHGDSWVLFGGIDGENKHNSVFVLDLATSTWSRLAPSGDTPWPREGHAAALLGQRMYVFGGNTMQDGEERYENDLHILDLVSHEWTRVQALGSLPRPRDSHAAAAWGGRLVVIGGDDTHEYLRDVWAYDPADNTWNEVQVANAADFTPRASFTAVATRDGILIFGGASIEMDFFNDCWLLQLGPSSSASATGAKQQLGANEGRWVKLSPKGPPPTPRFVHAATLLGDVMYVTGGTGPGEQVFADLHALQLHGASQPPRQQAQQAQQPQPPVTGQDSSVSPAVSSHDSGPQPLQQAQQAEVAAPAPVLAGQPAQLQLQQQQPPQQSEGPQDSSVKVMPHLVALAARRPPPPAANGGSTPAGASQHTPPPPPPPPQQQQQQQQGAIAGNGGPGGAAETPSTLGGKASRQPSDAAAVGAAGPPADARTGSARAPAGPPKGGPRVTFLTSYNMYQEAMRPIVKAQNPSMESRQAGAIDALIGVMWGKLSDAEKKPYKAQASDHNTSIKHLLPERKKRKAASPSDGPATTKTAKTKPTAAAASAGTAAAAGSSAPSQAPDSSFADMEIARALLEMDVDGQQQGKYNGIAPGAAAAGGASESEKTVSAEPAVGAAANGPRWPPQQQQGQHTQQGQQQQHAQQGQPGGQAAGLLPSVTPVPVGLATIKTNAARTPLSVFPSRGPGATLPGGQPAQPARLAGLAGQAPPFQAGAATLVKGQPAQLPSQPGQPGQGVQMPSQPGAAMLIRGQPGPAGTGALEQYKQMVYQQALNAMQAQARAMQGGQPPAMRPVTAVVPGGASAAAVGDMPTAYQQQAYSARQEQLKQFQQQQQAYQQRQQAHLRQEQLKQLREQLQQHLPQQQPQQQQQQRQDLRPATAAPHDAPPPTSKPAGNGAPATVPPQQQQQQQDRGVSPPQQPLAQSHPASVPGGDAAGPAGAAASSPEVVSLGLYQVQRECVGCKVEGVIDGVFGEGTQGGYTAMVDLNGVKYRAVLTSPYLALQPPQHHLPGGSGK
ncbi:hypothetical protein N2152v2_011057 [Parachlorella kessleri]